ncbi:MAG: hypothetical protein C5B59_04350 [Bacteroidetes bacterium]|nr:MAG: hypothetical protein C5B59_04350 [Bacteroidota bacterium]
MKIIAISLAAVLIFCEGCLEHAYYLSSSNANSNPYHAAPLQSDSVKSATYLDALFTIGSANQDWSDNLFAVRMGVHRAHTLGNFHLFYGANGSVGSYNISSSYYYSQNGNLIQPENRGSKLFAGYGFNGGCNALIPINGGGEWRVFGLEGSAQNEFGDYYNFRKNFPDSISGIVSRSHWTGTIGMTSEIIARSRRGTAFGYKFSLGTNVDSYYNSYTLSRERPFYVSNTVHFTKGNVTAFWQLNFGSYAGNFQFGMNYKLGR